MKVSAQEIANALLEWRGNVQQAADALGIRRNSLYERIRSLGLNLEGFRAANDRVIPVTGVSGVPGVSGMSGSVCPDVSGRNDVARVTGRDRRKTEGALVTAQGQTRRFRTVQVMNDEDTAVSVPIKAIPGRSKAPRLRPNQQDRLREAKFDLNARYRVETDENLILQQFFDENFEEWVRVKLAQSVTRSERRAEKKGGAS